MSSPTHTALARLEPCGTLFTIGPAISAPGRWRGTFPIEKAPHWAGVYFSLAKFTRRPDAADRYWRTAEAIEAVAAAAAESPRPHVQVDLPL